MPIKAVLFDLDGTLLDRDTSLALFVHNQYNRLPQLHEIDKGEYMRSFIALDNHGYVWKDKVYQQLIEEFSIKGLSWEELLHDYVNRFKEHCVGYPNLMSMLNQLKISHIKIALVSNGFGQFQFDNFIALGIDHFFDEVLISEWEGIRKPDPAIFLRALSKLGVSPNEALFIGDHPENDIQASRNTGMRAIWKRSNPYAMPIEADAIIDDLGELIEHIHNF
ncbi:putative hydrolase of the HAD superfamily [Paenibacillus castaneae]|uniref:HAD family hydrolase n=1 Tax=Paenibacillus castaneae TaxID=474957 RepID=UPI000C9CD338|nr:HAD family hydrolase [Paenibacillus castaneae]NIK76799.1 putative hydrolase of the HAD superfamily [Paenibacillus castaneae]